MCFPAMEFAELEALPQHLLKVLLEALSDAAQEVVHLEQDSRQDGRIWSRLAKYELAGLEQALGEATADQVCLNVCEPSSRTVINAVERSNDFTELSREQFQTLTSSSVDDTLRAVQLVGLAERVGAISDT